MPINEEFLSNISVLIEAGDICLLVMMWPPFDLAWCVHWHWGLFVTSSISIIFTPYQILFWLYILTDCLFFLPFPCRSYIPACHLQSSPKQATSYGSDLFLFLLIDICDAISYLVGLSLTSGSVFLIFCWLKTCWPCPGPVNLSGFFSNAIRSGCSISLNYWSRLSRAQMWMPFDEF